MTCAQERGGLITRAAMVVSGAVETRPVMKGLHIRERLLCGTLNPPPDDLGESPPVTEDMTTRENLDAVTSPYQYEGARRLGFGGVLDLGARTLDNVFGLRLRRSVLDRVRSGWSGWSWRWRTSSYPRGSRPAWVARRKRRTGRT